MQSQLKSFSILFWTHIMWETQWLFIVQSLVRVAQEGRVSSGLDTNQESPIQD